MSIANFQEGNRHEKFYTNRELSWLDFNKRVIEEAKDRTVPVLERLKFLSIYDTNVEEFFMVRVGSLTDLSKLKKKQLITSQT